MSMNTMLLAAFGLVALGAIIRLVLIFTAPKDRAN
jgi:uncharacterized membrane protein YqjE